LQDGFTVDLDNDPSEIERFTALVEALGERCDLPPKLVFQLTLVFDELLTNVISYGFPDGGQHKIAASVEISGTELVATLTDDGVAFDPLAKAAPDTTLSVEDRAIGGLGVHLVRTLMDKVDYRREAGQNRLVMTKTISIASEI
jgi:anti-sigma regulatory factor (Ser/Thr protein kinase)